MINRFLSVMGVVLFCLVTASCGEQKPSSHLDQAHELMKPNVYTGIDSILVYQNGELIEERYYNQFTKETPHRTHSTFKSITALITLIAMDQDILSPDENAIELLSIYGKSNQSTELRNEMTVEHLLNMSSGLSCDEAPAGDGPNHEWGVDEGDTPLQYSLDIPMGSAPGREWHYCSANSFMLAAAVSAALERSDREDIFTFAKTYLIEPLGITDFRFTRSIDGRFLNGQGNSYFLPRDLAKIGALVLNDGQWQGEQIISREAISKIKDAQYEINWSFVDRVSEMKETPSRYSHQWYHTTFDVDQKAIPSIHSWGNGGQFIFVVPSLKAVIVFTGSNQGNFPKQVQPFDIMHKYVLPDLIERAG